MGPGNHSLPGIIHLPSGGVKKRPIPHVTIFHGHPLQGPSLVPATSWVFHTSGPPRSPNSPTLLLEVQGRASSYSPLLSFWLASKGSSQPPVPTPADLISWNLWGLLISFRLQTPLGRVVFKVGGMAVLWPHLLFHPLDLHPQWSQLLELAQASGKLLVRGQLRCSISSSKGATIARAFQWASLASVRLLSVEVSLLPLLGVLLLRDWSSVGLGSPVICGISPPSTPGNLLRRTTPLPQVLALQGKTPVASGVCIPHSIGIWTLPYWSGALPAGQWIHPPWGPALEGHVGSPGRSYILPFSVLAPRHAGTSHAIWQDDGAIHFPSSLPLQAQFHIHMAFCLPYWQTLPSCPLFGGKGLVSLAPICQC